MSDLIKQQSKKRIIEDLENLSPVDFENVGHNVVCCLEKSKQFRHPGVNKDNIPIKGSVDTISQDGFVVAEYSIDKEYFKTSEKPIHDINHAFITQPQCNKLYLLSSQIMPPSYFTSIKDTDEYKNFSKKSKIYFYGANEIAEEIIRQSENLQVQNLFCYYLTSYSNYVEQYECFGKLPQQDEEYISNFVIQDAIKKHFKTNNICILNGVSGSGKTQAAIEFAKNLGKEVIWVNGSDFEQASTFSSVKAGRNGNAFNIAGFFNTGDKLLIIDDIKKQVTKENFAELSTGLNNKGFIFCTSQLHLQNEIYLPIPSFSKEMIQKLLQEESDFICSKENQEIYEICKNSPMGLKYIRSAYAQVCSFRDRNEFYKDILVDIISVTDDKCESLIKKIVGKISDDSTKELLEFICSIDVAGFNNDILYKLLKLKRKTIEDLSLLYPEQSYNVFSIHDLVKKALRKHDDESNIKYLDFMNSEVAKLKGEMTTPILHQAYLNRSLFQSFLQQNFDDKFIWLYYLILQTNGEERKLVTDIFKDKEIMSDTLLPELLCIIDSNENYLISKSYSSSEEKNNLYKIWIASLKKAANLFKENNEALIGIFHHLGKAYRRNGECDNARECFEKVLSIKPNNYETWNQIINLGSTKNVSKELQNLGSEYFKKMLLQIQNDFESVTLRIKLAFVTFANYGNYKTIVNNPECLKLFASIIRKSYLNGFEQIYEAFVSFIRLYSYEYNEQIKNLFESISSIVLIDINYKILSHFSDFLDAFSTIFELEDEKYQDEIKPIILSVINTGVQEDLPDFEKRAVLKAYNSIGLSEKNIEYFIKNCAKKTYSKGDFYSLYHYAKALCLQNRYEDSLNVCKILRNLNAGFNLSNTYEIEGVCYKKLERFNEAISSFQMAIDLTSEGKYKNALQGLLNECKNIFDRGNK